MDEQIKALFYKDWIKKLKDARFVKAKSPIMIQESNIKNLL